MKQLLGWSTNHDGTDSVSDRCATWMHHQNQGTGTKRIGSVNVKISEKPNAA